MIQGRSRPGLLSEAVEAIPIIGERAWQNLYGDIPRQPGIVGAINFAHTASADLLGKGVWPDLLPCED